MDTGNTARNPYSWVKAKVSGDKDNRWSRLRPWAALVVVALVVAGFIFRRFLPSAESAGYPGVFLLSVIGSGTMFLPVPSLASVCVGASVLGLSPLFLGLVAALGESIGELTGYLAGVSGRNVLERTRLHNRLLPMVRRHGGLVIFLFALIPNPLFDVVGVLAGSLEYPLARFLAIAFAGKFLKDTAIALGCSYGVDALIRFFQRPVA